ncbi:MAG: Gfo/Idh/MocA family oxidoreductase [Clostridia bacterium]|nr:Gfo/Idh/MocA family oxidoreductase [Clostridia bacterium]
MKNTLRVALIGCGEISGNHIGAILAAGEDLCALCDILPERAKQKAEKYGLSDVLVYTDYLKMLDEVKPDVVHICTPHDLHAPMAIAALSKDINVLCEKPLCISLEQLADLRSAAKNSHATLGVCHQNRFKPSMVAIKKMAESGVMGAFGSVVWKRDENYYASGEWRGTWEHEGGGVMINQALHTLDLLQWICGMPTHVIASVGNWTHRDCIEVEDTASARFETAEGLPINFFATTSAGASLPISVQLTLADKKKICAQNHILTVDDEIVALPKREGVLQGKEVWGSEHAVLIAKFYQCLKTGEKFPIDLEEGSRVVRLILAMYRSNGERIEIPN